MKLMPLFLLAPVVLGCQQSSQSPPASEELTEVAFEVPNMVCEFSCVPMVEDILAQQPGVKHVDVDLETKTATVLVDEEKFDAEAAIAELVDVQFIDTRLKAPGDKETATASVAQNTNG